MSQRMRASQNPRRERELSPSAHAWRRSSLAPPSGQLRTNVTLECGWGRLIFAHTFESNRTLAQTLCEERAGARDIAIYLGDPHVVVVEASGVAAEVTSAALASAKADYDGAISVR